MGILQALKALFRRDAPAADATTVSKQELEFDGQAYLAPFNALLAEGFKMTKIASVRFEHYYGDFPSFLYRPGFDLFLREEVLHFRDPSSVHNDFLDNNYWAARHPFNFPGPFYTGESDTCGTGIVEAPSNVANDDYCCEYVFKQPTNYYDFLCVLNAAAVEVIDSYSSNGNEHWTYEACREWWRGRAVVMRHLTRPEVITRNDGQAQLYLDYLNGKAEIDLRRYCFFLLHGVYPDDHAVLPEL